MPKQYQWGIIGTGNIARTFLQSIREVERCHVRAAGSRTPGKAEAFAKTFGISHAHSGYEAIYDDPAIDAVYVATTHNFHHEIVLKALESGKHVLCEKPLAVNARQAREMVAQAKASDRFLMEGMWTRFLPAMVQARQWLDAGEIGAVRQVQASFGFTGNFPETGRLLNPELAGGCLLDAGIYPLSFISMVMKAAQPVSRTSFARLAKTGVDTDISLHLRFADEVTAHGYASFDFLPTNDAEVFGEHGTIRLKPLFIGAQAVELVKGKTKTTMEFPFPREQGFRYQIEAVRDCLDAAKTECAIMPLQETVQLAEWMDGFREEWGVRYPGESK